MKNTISGLLKTRDDMMAELVAVRDRAASIYNDIKAVDRVLDALGYDGPLDERSILTLKSMMPFGGVMNLQKETLKFPLVANK